MTTRDNFMWGGGGGWYTNNAAYPINESVSYKIYRNKAYTATQLFTNMGNPNWDVMTSPCPMQITDNIIWDPNTTATCQYVKAEDMPNCLMDRNQYWAPIATGGKIIKEGTTAQFKTLAEWRTLTGKDTNSTDDVQPPGWTVPPSSAADF
jgi:hypothetical protein